MLKRIKYIILIISFTCGAIAFGQNKPAKVWATATFNKSSVMLGEPLVVTITVYTSTWFTKAPIFEEIQVKDAIMVPLEKRSNATSITIGRKQYPAIKQQFVVYPNRIGKNTLPSFKVTLTSPPEGDYKGRERIVQSKTREFTVLPPPEGIDTKNWIAAYNVKLTDSWNTPLKDLKAGDVLERRITINASGALSAAIPPLEIDTINFGSIYFKTPLLNNRQNTNSFSGTRVEIINYLIESDGDFTIPEVNFNWFNLRTKTLKTETIKPLSISVAPNPDLDFILSRQKELQAELALNEAIAEEEDPEPFVLFGLNWWQLLLVLASLILVIKVIFNVFSKLKFKRKQREQLELESEGHYFKLLIEAIHAGQSDVVIKQLFFWYDRFRENRYNPALSDLISRTNATDFVDHLKLLEEEVYKKDNANYTLIDKNKLSESIKLIRQKVFNVHELETKDGWMHINP